jgi:hypothetical protein
VVQTVKKNLKVDWGPAAPGRRVGRGPATVSRVLRKHDIREEDFGPLLDDILKQAEAAFAD